MLPEDVTQDGGRPNRKYIFISACTLDRNTTPNPKPMLRPRAFDDIDTLNPCYPKSEPKMAAAQTGKTYISACTLYRNTIPNPK